MPSSCRLTTLKHHSNILYRIHIYMQNSENNKRSRKTQHNNYLFANIHPYQQWKQQQARKHLRWPWQISLHQYQRQQLGTRAAFFIKRQRPHLLYCARARVQAAISTCARVISAVLCRARSHLTDTEWQSWLTAQVVFRPVCASYSLVGSWILKIVATDDRIAKLCTKAHALHLFLCTLHLICVSLCSSPRKTVEAHVCTQAYTQTTILPQARPNQPQRKSLSVGKPIVYIAIM